MALVFTDTSRQVLLRLIMVVGITMVIAWTFVIVAGNPAYMVTGIGGGVLTLAWSYYSFRMRQIEKGLLILCWGLWCYAVVFGVLVAGIRTPVLLIVPCLIMIVAWIRGRRNVVIMTILSIAYFIFIAIAEDRHWLMPPIHRSSLHIMIVYVGISVICSVVALMIAENFRRLISKGVGLTNELRNRIAELRKSDAALRELNEQLEQRVADRTHQFEEANKSLQQTIAKLGNAQAELVHAEKMASLGSMVAGISHELNTPIGNVLTLTTSMETKYQSMLEALADGHVKKSELDEFLHTGHEMSVLATRSTRRAVELVSSFKQVAVDQTSEQRRNFNLRVVVEDNIATLWPSIKSRRDSLQINNLVPDGITCDSYPGPLGQVLINLAQNAILHGLADNPAGIIAISAEAHGDSVSLTVADNGIGMPPAILAHVFDPFFTTKLGKGGSGLGLSVSYRIVTSVLGGTIAVSSLPGQGARFVLTFPTTAPFKM